MLPGLRHTHFQPRSRRYHNANGGLVWIKKGGGYYSECNKHLKG